MSCWRLQTSACLSLFSHPGPLYHTESLCFRRPDTSFLFLDIHVVWYVIPLGLLWFFWSSRPIFVTLRSRKTKKPLFGDLRSQLQVPQHGPAPILIFPPFPFMVLTQKEYRRSAGPKSVLTMAHTESVPFVTHPALHIRDLADVHRVLEAVRLNMLPLIKRRLVPHERAQLRSGNVFVWEQSEYDDGLVRWTEGRRWSQSKMRGDCLVYEEKIGTTKEEKHARAIRRARRASDSSEPIPMPPKRKDRPAKIDGLTKQTYSVTIRMPGTAKINKWHVVAYFTARNSSLLPVVEDYEYLRNIRIPDGVFLRSSRSDTGTLEWFTRPVKMPDCSSSTRKLLSPVIRNSDPDICSNSQPSQDKELPIVLPPISPVVSPTILPPLASLGCLSSSAGTRHTSSALRKVERYHRPSTCPDDRRILERFRVVI
ncbi:Gti1/Pac2 family-domain-containing protein [Mycena haematopus]|nr:Gti1/Pac2 family-domain-containing protein [Mycena haematopus]